MSSSTCPSVEEWVEKDPRSRFYTRRWSPPSEPKGYILAVHGFMDHCSRYVDWFDRFNSAGYGVLAFDQRGCGRTAAENHSQGYTSFPQALDDLDFFVSRLLTIADGHKVFLYGHSMGGALTMTYVTRPHDYPNVSRLSGYICSAPLLAQSPETRASPILVRLGSILGHIAPRLRMHAGLASKNISRDPKVNEAYANDPLCSPVSTYRQYVALLHASLRPDTEHDIFDRVGDMLLAGSTLMSSGIKTYPPTLPLLMYHGSNDKLTSHDATKEFADKVQAQDKTFESWQGYYHELHNEPGDDKWKVYEHVLAWLERH